MLKLIAMQTLLGGVMIGSSLWAMRHNNARLELLGRDAALVLAGGLMLLAGHTLNWKFWTVAVLTGSALALLVKDLILRRQPVRATR
ncbi:hypothetical protein [Lacticaseibacillus absianus]|uniref:hypothetical protein n=1 Tax=Lacticaseibacillus absianus TaxID=2729623 RepID=UPI0015CC72D3|nr:hypothetical protein [Lacticaseibacillus absianus]